MQVTLYNLTDRQKFLAEILWNTQSAEAVTALIKLLPEPFKQDARVMRELLTAAVFDQTDGTDLANDLLDKFRK